MTELPEPSDLETAKALRGAAAGVRQWLTGEHDAAIRAVIKGNPVASVSALLALNATFIQRSGDTHGARTFLSDFVLEQTDIITRLEAEADG